MDKLAERLRHDAEQIDVAISAELDDRLRASLTGVVPEQRQPPATASRPVWFCWASSLTGAAAAVAVILIVNLRAPEPLPAVPGTVAAQRGLAPIAWQIKPAVLTSPLEQEIEDLQSDLKRAEEALKADIETIF
ncbi:MAG: hypothetical protein OEO82_00990 [Gammaproteobacteria bacterium]|nr:hypothetical protein [Gammaproteobacteria bacterium]